MRSSFFFLASIALLACADDDTGAPPGPTMVVTVVRSDDGIPVASAPVLVDGTMVGTTTSDGTLDTGVPADSRPVVVSVRAVAFAPHVFFGLSTLRRTIAIDRSDIATATSVVRGTVAGWSSLPAPPAGHFYRASIVRERSVAELIEDGVFDFESALARGLVGTCTGSATCEWSLRAAPGTLALAGTIDELEGDPTATDARLVATIATFAATDVDVPASGGEIGDVMLAPIEMRMASFALPAPDGELSEVIGVPGVGVTPGHAIVFLGDGTGALPAAVAPLADARPWAVAWGQSDDRMVTSIRLQRDVDLSATVTVDPLVGAPAAELAEDGELIVPDRTGTVFVRARRGPMREQSAWTAWIEREGQFQPDLLGLSTEGVSIAVTDVMPSSIETLADAETAATRVLSP